MCYVGAHTGTGSFLSFPFDLMYLPVFLTFACCCRKPGCRPKAGQTAPARGRAEEEAGGGPAGERGVQEAAGLDSTVQNYTFIVM